jgi:endogenous inhibitor of DNA gyrase (YacG/DUF329 family)
MADLGRWLSEDYRVPDEGAPDRPDDGQSSRRPDDDHGRNSRPSHDAGDDR